MLLRVALMVAVLLQGTLSIEEKYKTLLLKLHNDARGNEGGSDMNELVWDDQLEQEASAWANRCVFAHQYKGRGENLAFNTNKYPESELTEIAFKGWFDEKNIYSYGQYSCGASCHYTQLVWATTRRVGCAMKRCEYLAQATANAWYLVCFYDPAGNKMGKKPYQKGSSCSKCRDDQTCSNRLCAGGSDPCEDLDENCDMWANTMNQCTKNKAFMKESCARACKFCKGGGSGEPTKGGRKPTKGGRKPNKGGRKPSKGNTKQKPTDEDCVDSDRRCPSWAKRGHCTRSARYMKSTCKKSCNVCGGGTSKGGGGNSTCRDENTSCAAWAARGECQANPRYMHRKCKKSCNTC
ncbi:serotriflin-like isoform X5 [Haliotis asinina]|uniref:serotriflin-like isoform X5 n=1 Tax=Haliotis asinina TaxID=109174 RepID=UPI003531ED5F